MNFGICVRLAAAAGLACASMAAAANAAVTQHATASKGAAFPTHGVVVPGRSIGGISLNMTETQVIKTWGSNYKVCANCGPHLVWLFEYRGQFGTGAAVKFNVPPPVVTTKTVSAKQRSSIIHAAANARVIAVFTLGQPVGWGVKGAMIGDPPTNVYSLFGSPGQVQCIGYSAMTIAIGTSTTSFYTSSGVIYGFALTSGGEGPCE